MKPRLHEDASIAQARIDLVTALRSAERLGLSEGVCNHFSFVLPGHKDLFLINPQGLHWSELCPSDLMIVKADGEVVAGKHHVEPTALFIHASIHRGSNKACVMHTHMPYATALTCLDDGKLDWVHQNSLRFYGRVRYDRNYGGFALDHAEGDRLCAALGSGDVLFMQHHGVVVCGESIAYAFDDLYYLERACMVQVLAQSTGRQMATIPEEICRSTARQIDGERGQSDLHLAALKRILDRGSPGWSTR